MTDRMSRIDSKREEDQNFDLYYDSAEVHQLYADGISSTGFSAANAKVHFYIMMDTHSETDDSGQTTQIEQRHIRYTLTIPTRALLEYCQKLLVAAKSNEEQFMNLYSEESQKINHILSFVIEEEKKD